MVKVTMVILGQVDAVVETRYWTRQMETKLAKVRQILRTCDSVRKVVIANASVVWIRYWSCQGNSVELPNQASFQQEQAKGRTHTAARVSKLWLTAQITESWHSKEKPSETLRESQHNKTWKSQYRVINFKKERRKMTNTGWDFPNKGQVSFWEEGGKSFHILISAPVTRSLNTARMWNIIYYSTVVFQNYFCVEKNATSQLTV